MKQTKEDFREFSEKVGKNNISIEKRKIAGSY
jgi:hypothetical protein